MARPDTGNAHIRKDSKRQSREVLAGDAQRLLDDPAFNEAYNAVREGLMTELENYQHDGQPSTDDYEREICRALRSLKSLRRALVMSVQGHKLRLADFSAKAPDKENA